MRITDNHSYAAPISLRSAVPAPAKELLKAQTSSSGGDLVTGIAAAAAEQRQERLTQLRQLVQTGKYEVNLRQVSSKMVDEHLDPTP